MSRNFLSFGPKSPIKTPELVMNESLDESKREAAKRRLIIGKILIDRVQSTITSYPSCPKIDGTLSNIQQDIKIMQRHKWGGPVLKAANFQDSVFIALRTEESLESQFHQLYIPQHGQVHYQRYSYNVDCQAIGSQNIDALGMEEISRSEDSINTLRQLVVGLRIEASYDWQNSFQNIQR